MAGFSMEYKDSIQKRMKEQYEKLANKADYEGSFSSDIIEANSIEFENSKAEMNLMIQAAFAGTAWGDYLTMRCAEYGIDRKLATSAIGNVTFSGQENIVVPAGSLVGVKNGVQFLTNDNCTLDESGKGTVAITCTETGTKGNVQAGTINNLPMSIAGVNSVTNLEATHDGFEQESDTELLNRYKIAVRTPSTSGNIYHYYNWAMSITGVGACKIVPLWSGAGTVKVIIVNDNMQTASAEIIKAVADYIESVRPIGATVTVISPVPKLINISVDVIGKVDKDLLISDINKYIQSRNLELTYISSAQVGKILMQQNISDYQNLTLNGQNRVDATQDELLSVGTVTINELTTFEG